MTRAASTILKSMIGKLHVGWAYGRRGREMDTVLLGAAEILADGERAAEDLYIQIDPRAATDLLVDFERVLGPDHCGRDLGDLTVSARQNLAHQRWTAFGGQSIPYMIGVAAKLGVEIEITEYWPSRAGGLLTGDRLIEDGEQFVYKISLEGGLSSLFRAGAGRSGERLGTFEPSPAECELRRIKPAHTEVVLSYFDYLSFDGEPLAFMGELMVLGGA